MKPSVLRQCMKDESGSTTFEYSMIAALFSVAVVAAVSAGGDSLASVFELLQSEVAGPMAG